jgi:hypothetical protein
MPLFFHAVGATPLPSAVGATGVGTSLHFIRNSTNPPAGNPCAGRADTDWQIIQVIRTNAPLGGNGQSYVDNAGGASPFYSDVYRGRGPGLGEIFPGYPDAGDQFNTTRSIYDRPSRPDASLGSIAGQAMSWQAEACVTCIRPGPDKVLGCATYGFTRPWVPAPVVAGAPAAAPGAPPAGAHGPVVPTNPGCLAAPSAHFVQTLRGYPPTASYSFET